MKLKISNVSHKYFYVQTLVLSFTATSSRSVKNVLLYMMFLETFVVFYKYVKTFRIHVVTYLCPELNWSSSMSHVVTYTSWSQSMKNRDQNHDFEPWNVSNLRTSDWISSSKMIKMNLSSNFNNLQASNNV